MAKYEVSGDTFIIIGFMTLVLIGIIGYNFKSNITELQEKVSWTEQQILDLIKEK